MILFLTSSPTGPLDGSYHVDGLDPKNNLTENLRKYWKEGARCLIITAAPDSFERNDEMTAFFHQALEQSGFAVSQFDLWDGRTADTSREKLHSYDVIFLGGGHVPTQNEFFSRIHLRESIQGFDGIVIGISAGSMNSADVVYAQPELPGEAVAAGYQRYLTGLNLTKTMILPHYQMVKYNYLDGMRLFDDITYGDSFGKTFLVLPDGSYLMSEDGRESVWGEAYQIINAKLYKICSENESCCYN